MDDAIETDNEGILRFKTLTMNLALKNGDM